MSASQIGYKIRKKNMFVIIFMKKIPPNTFLRNRVLINAGS